MKQDMIEFTEKEKHYLKYKQIWSFYEKKGSIPTPFKEPNTKQVRVMFDKTFWRSPVDAVYVLKKRNAGGFDPILL
jgi:hypothetical protein